jgi:hypothetical protein
VRTFFGVLLATDFSKNYKGGTTSMSKICEVCDVFFEELLSCTIPIDTTNKNHHCGSSHCTKAAPEAPSVEWSRTYNDLQALSVIQTSDDGFAIVGAGWASEAATFIKIDSSGNLEWQKIKF